MRLYFLEMSLLEYREINLYDMDYESKPFKYMFLIKRKMYNVTCKVFRLS